MTGPDDDGNAPPVVPRPAATVMLLRDGNHGLEVLLLRRSADTPFVPGAHVFPGGAVETRDHDGAVPDFAGAAPDFAAGGVDHAHARAVVRECLEEAGVLLARTDTGAWVDATHPALADLGRLRVEVDAGRTDLFAHCAAHGVVPAVDALAYVSHWVTPPPSPRRYDTRFFAARMPPGQAAVEDAWEVVDAAWWRPDAALAAWRSGNIVLIEPTVASLRLLTRFASADDAVTRLRAAAATGRTVREPEGGTRVALPDDLPEPDLEGAR